MRADNPLKIGCWATYKQFIYWCFLSNVLELMMGLA